MSYTSDERRRDFVASMLYDLFRKDDSMSIAVVIVIKVRTSREVVSLILFGESFGLTDLEISKERKRTYSNIPDSN
jgi:hypothetical protein